MTPPVLLSMTPPSTLTLTLNAVVDTADTHSKRNIALPPLGVFIPPTPALSPSSSSHHDDDDDTDASPAHPTPARVRQWTGMPIRAIVPLPRRMRVVTAPACTPGTHQHQHQHHLQDAAPRELVGPSPGCSSLAAARAQWADPDSDDSSAEIAAEDDNDDEDEDEEVDSVRVRIKDREHAPAASRYCAYESITAAEGLSAWSFEELRVECYAQSRIARGTKPPPVDQPYLAIPPAFVPRIIHRN